MNSDMTQSVHMKEEAALTAAESGNNNNNNNNATMLSMETAVGLHLNSRSCKLLAMDDYMALCRKVSAKESTPHDFLVSALGAGLYKLSKVSLGSETSWCLAPLPVSGSRLMALQRGASSTTPEIDQALASVRTSSKARVALPKRAPSAAKKVPTSVLIRPGMTIDERVAARAAAKVQQQALSAGQPQDNCLDSSWLVRIADALWQHSRSIADRQARLSAGRRTLSNTPCSSTLMDVLDYLSRSLGQQAATNQVEKTSRRQLVAALQEIAKTAGDWLQIHSETAEISKNSTVWIYPSQFKAARAKLMGQPLPKEATERPLKRPLTTNHESSNFATPSTTTVTPKTPIPIVTAEGSSSALLPIAKKQRLGPVVTTLASETTTPKKKPTLRINPFLILNESDYVGGEIIQPTAFDSPRGLKNLFHQLNSGKRI